MPNDNQNFNDLSLSEHIAKNEFIKAAFQNHDTQINLTKNDFALISQSTFEQRKKLWMQAHEDAKNAYHKAKFAKIREQYKVNMIAAEAIISELDYLIKIARELKD